MNRKYFLLFCLLFAAVCQTKAQGQWAWMHGPSQFNVDSGIYGTMGVSDSVNYPSPRAGACGWLDNKGNFWIYSGSPLHYSCSTCSFTDMWRFNPVSLEWTWISGPDTAIYVLPKYDTTKGCFSPNNHPGMRVVSSTWTDDDGNLWLAGGLIGGQSNYFGAPDVWKYDININQWAWMGGAKATAYYSAQCGTIPNAAHNPGGIYDVTSCWREGSKVYIFGGMKKDNYQTFPQPTDQFAVYNMDINQWTCLSIGNSQLTPIERSAYSAWMDTMGRLWLLGGKRSEFVDFKDFWRFNKDSLTWTLLSNGNGVYPPLCVEDTQSYPSARRTSGLTITDSCGRFWFYGGTIGGKVIANDLWMFNPYSNIWKLMSGNDSVNTTGFYGTYRVPSPVNLPPAKAGVNGFLNSNGIWLFGGQVDIDWPGVPLCSTADFWLYKPEPISATFTYEDSLSPDYTFTGNAIVSCSNDASKYIWRFDDVASGSFNEGKGKYVNHHFVTPGIHNIIMYAMDCFGHYDTVTQVINVKIPSAVENFDIASGAFIPTAFSPNGDGLNDFFVFDIPVVSQAEVSIFNRNGKLIYNNPAQQCNMNTTGAWDGTYNGVAASSETYVYRITFYRGKMAKTLTGSITLLK